jgi:hypothetical protein
MAEYALRVRFESDLILLGKNKQIMTWSNSESAMSFARENGIWHKVHASGMFYDEDWYSKTVTVEELQESA